VVFYMDDVVIGGGLIEASLPDLHPAASSDTDETVIPVMPPVISV
jgi:hypothetical protein